MSYQKHITEHQRRSILSVLSENSDYSHNSAVLQMALHESGNSISSDKLLVELAWLAENGLITLKAEPTTVARLTQRGLDVAMGTADVPGIARKGV